jgi:phage tail sheath gpL-like
MSGDFSEFPDAVRLPFTYTEFDPSQADRGLTEMSFNVLLVGQMLPTGKAAPLTPKRPMTENQAYEMFGRDSQLGQMCAAYFKANRVTKMTAIGVLDYVGGVTATATLTFAGTVTRPVPICLYIGGILVRLGTAAGDTAATVMSNLMDKINSSLNSPVTAAMKNEVLTLLAKHKGECGNDIDLRFSYLEEDFPDGLTVEIEPMATGAGNPEPEPVIAAMAGQRYHMIAWPWQDLATLNALRTELDDRWGPLVQNDGQAVIVKTGSFTEVVNFAASRNDKHLTVLPNEGSPTLPWVDCAASVGILAFYGADDPARPFQSLVIPGVLAPAVEARWSNFPERNQALYEACSTRAVNDAGQVFFTRVITTHLKNEWGAETEAYLELNTVLTLSYLRYDWNNYIQTKYPRHKLASDEMARRMNPGQPVMTPSLGRAEAISRMHEWMRQGLVEAPDDFASRLRVERDPNNPNRLNWVMSPDLVNQFVIAATAIKFLL